MTFFPHSSLFINKFTYIKYSFSLFYSSRHFLLSSFYRPQTDSCSITIPRERTLFCAIMYCNSILPPPTTMTPAQCLARPALGWPAVHVWRISPAVRAELDCGFVQIWQHTSVLSAVIYVTDTRRAFRTGGEYFYPNWHSSFILKACKRSVFIGPSFVDKIAGY